MQFPHIYEVDISRPVQPVPLQQMLVQGDNLANRIGVRLKNGVAPVAVSGTCTGIALRADGNHVDIAGAVAPDGEYMYIDLPQAAYAVEGQITISIANSDNGTICTPFVGFGTVIRTSSGAAIDPGTVMPAYSTLIAAIEAARASIPTDYTDLVAQVDYITDQTGLETDITSDVTLTDGKFILSNTGAESGANSDYSNSESVDVTGYDFVRITMPAVTMSSTNMGLAFYGSDESYISGFRVEYGQLVTGFLTAEYHVPANAKYIRTSWFSSGGDFSSLYSNFACSLIKKPQKAGRYVPTWNAGGLAPSTGLPSANSKRIYSDWRKINSGDGIISCADGYTFGVFCKNAIGSYLGWFNQRTALFSVSAITGYTSIDTQWLIAHEVDQISIVLISANDITPIEGSNVTWTCDQGAADATTALEQIGTASGRIDALYRDIAAVETNPATRAHGAGEYIIFDGQLYEVANEIAAGETLTVGTNIESRTLGDMLTDIKLFNAISIFDSVDSLGNGDYVLRAQKTTNGKRLYWEPVE